MPPERTYPLRPVRGFGWVGWVSLFVLLVFVGSLLAGVDVRYQAQRLVAAAFGVEALYALTIHGIAAHYLAFYIPTLFPWAGIPILVAMHLAPGPHRLLAGTLVVIWMFVSPGVWLSLTGLLPDFGLSMIVGRMMSNGVLVAIAMDLSVLGVLWIVTRDWVIVAAGVVGMAVAWPIASIPSPSNVWCFVGLGILHSAVAPAILRWGIRARRDASRPAYICPTCGYDLRGNPGQPCPECGFIESKSGGR